MVTTTYGYDFIWTVSFANGIHDSINAELTPMGHTLQDKTLNHIGIIIYHNLIKLKCPRGDNQWTIKIYSPYNFVIILQF